MEDEEAINPKDAARGAPPPVSGSRQRQDRGRHPGARGALQCFPRRAANLGNDCPGAQLAMAIIPKTRRAPWQPFVKAHRAPLQ